MVTVDLIERARDGDGEAFRELTEPHRRELHVHCYRMLGSLQDAEDALQDALLAAWQGLEGFEGRASIRTWLYRIATNRCLNARRSATRRAAREWDVPGVEPPEPTKLGEVVWLEPFPDAFLDTASDLSLGPEARYAQTESLSLAFVTALQVLPPRQLAVLILRDVVGFHAAEVADMLDSTVDSVNSVLKRARAGLEGQRPPAVRRAAPPASGSPAEDAIVARFVSAYETRISTRWWPSSPTTSSSRCRRCRSSTRVAISSPVSAPASLERDAGSIWCGRAPTISRRSEPT